MGRFPINSWGMMVAAGPKAGLSITPKAFLCVSGISIQRR